MKLVSIELAQSRDGMGKDVRLFCIAIGSSCLLVVAG